MNNYFIISGIIALAGLAVASSSFTADAGTSLTAIGSRQQRADCLSSGGKIWNDENCKTWCKRTTSEGSYGSTPASTGLSSSTQQPAGCNSPTPPASCFSVNLPHY